MAMKKARKTSDSEKLSISLSKTVYAWAQELAAAKGFDTNFSAYVADLIRRDQEREQARKINIYPMPGKRHSALNEPDK